MTEAIKIFHAPKDDLTKEFGHSTLVILALHDNPELIVQETARNIHALNQSHPKYTNNCKVFAMACRLSEPETVVRMSEGEVIVKEQKPRQIVEVQRPYAIELTN